jgi:hypothetical protein
MKHFCILLLFALLMGCSSAPDTSLDQKKETAAADSIPAENSSIADTLPPVDGLELFIDSMEKENYRIDTTRLKKIGAWSRIARAPKGLRKGHVFIAAPFPVKSESKYFSDPETYYFVPWDPKTKSYKNGDDYLLMTWKLDSAGIKREDALYLAIFEYTGYFPSYCFRSGERIYVVITRMVNNAVTTAVLTEHLKDYIDPSATVYGIHNSHLLRKKRR